jgi:hypothetical protein
LRDLPNGIPEEGKTFERRTTTRLEELAMADVAKMSAAEKIEEAMRRSLPRLGPDAQIIDQGYIPR